MNELMFAAMAVLVAASSMAPAAVKKEKQPVALPQHVKGK